LRTIRECREYVEQYEKLGLEIRRLDEVRESVDWALARHPETFTEVPATDLRVLPTAEFPEVPELVLYFRVVGTDYIDLVWVELVDEDPDDPLD